MLHNTHNRIGFLNCNNPVRHFNMGTWEQEKGDEYAFGYLGSEFKREFMDTIGSLVDKLTIINIRIWMAEDIKRAKDATDKQIADATRITNIANQQRNNLIEEIDQALGVTTGQGSTKMYGKTI